MQRSRPGPSRARACPAARARSAPSGASTSERYAASHCSRVNESGSPGGGPPVLQTRISTGPSAASTASTSAPGAVDVAGVPGEALGAARAGGDARALGFELGRDRRADPLRGAGDERHPAGQPEVHARADYASPGARGDHGARGRLRAARGHGRRDTGSRAGCAPARRRRGGARAPVAGARRAAVRAAGTRRRLGPVARRRAARRAATHDGIPNKQRSVVLPRARRGAAVLHRRRRPVRPRRRRQRRRKPAAGGRGGRASLRRRVVRPLAIAAHRARRARSSRRCVRPGPPDGFEGVRILLMHAYGMGGTIRTCLTLAEHLAEHGPVEVISIVRSRDEPFFAFPEGVTVTVLDDRRGRLRAARTLPSAPRPSRRPHLREAQPAHRRCACCAACAACARASLVTTRPGFNVLAARHAPRGADGRRPGAHEHRLAPARRSRTTSSAPTAGSTRSRCSPRPTAPTTRACSPARAHARRADPQRGAGARRRHGLARQPRRRRRRPADAAEGLRPADRRVRRASRAEHPDWQLRIHGAGPQRAELRRLILEHDLYYERLPHGPDAAARRGARAGVDLRAELALRGLRHGDRRGDEQGPGGRRASTARAARRRSSATAATACSCRRSTSPRSARAIGALAGDASAARSSAQRPSRRRAATTARRSAPAGTRCWGRCDEGARHRQRRRHRGPAARARRSRSRSSRRARSPSVSATRTASSCSPTATSPRTARRSPG